MGRERKEIQPHPSEVGICLAVTRPVEHSSALHSWHQRQILSHTVTRLMTLCPEQALPAAGSPPAAPTPTPNPPLATTAYSHRHQRAPRGRETAGNKHLISHHLEPLGLLNTDRWTKLAAGQGSERGNCRHSVREDLPRFCEFHSPSP